MAMFQSKYKVQVTLVSEMLGTVALSKDVYGKYIASKAADLGVAEAELETVRDIALLPAGAVDVQSVLDNLTIEGSTGFHEKDGQKGIYPYVIRGFMKAACGALRRNSTTESAKLKAYAKIIDTCVFVKPSFIPITLGGPVGVCVRPMRGDTPRGQRISLARSETVPSGSVIEFEVWVIGGITEELLQEWFEYGAFQGLGQWRSGGHGQFLYKMERI